MARLRSLSLPQLPPMQCDKGCGECCGIVACSQEEFDRIAGIVRVRGLTPQRQGTTCPLYIGGQCSIYHARPLVCQLYGHAPDLTCPRGYNTNAAPHVEARWTQGMRSLPGMRFLHELAYSPAEFQDIILTTMTA